MLTRTECAGCGSTHAHSVADLGETPLADLFPATADAAMTLPRYPLRVAICGECQLAQLVDVIEDDVLYGDSYGFRTGGSPSSYQYMHSLAGYVRDRHAVKGRTVEIASNDGTLLAELQAATGDALGIDPSGATDVARRRGLNVQQVPFTAKLAEQMKGEAAMVVAVNVAAHVADPHDFMEGVRLLLKPGGKAIIEFQYLPDLLAGGMFDLIYHEHRFFYTAGSFGWIAACHGLAMTEIVHTPAQGGSLRVTLSADEKPEPPGGEWDISGVLAGLVSGFQARAEYARLRIADTVCGFRGTLCGFAASAKSCTLLNWCGIGGGQLACVVDTTPSKYGRYTPGTGIPITDQRADVDGYLLLASNYLGGVIRREQTRGYKGKFIVPLPLPVIV